MFGSFHGLPVHALVLHVAVVVTPLAALAGLLFLVPRWRARLRWPLVAISAVAAVTIFVTKESGQDLRSALGTQLTGPGNLSGQLIAEHAKFANRLMIAVIVMFVVVVAVVLLLGRAGRAWIGSAGAVGIAVVAVIVLVLTYQTGEAGAKAVWNPAGSFDYSAGQ